MSDPRARHYPLSAIVGQERLKLALLLNAVEPAIGGVLIRGEKGSAKSTAVRALAALLPDVEVVAGCPYACHPAHPFPDCPHCTDRELTPARRPARVVDLPLGATEDRVLGTLELEAALQTGARRFEPGLLAAAHRGVLYIDEVNLLPDHLVDLLLDAAAMGWNVVEREGVSFAHPAQFILIGTMNPEEGELRPQLLDRFGLVVEVGGLTEPADRAEAVRRRLAYDADPATFVARWADAEAVVRGRLAAARALLPRVTLGDDLLDLIARVCVEIGVDGLRADLAIGKTARVLAAYEGRLAVTVDDLRRAAELALPHRRRRQPFDQGGLDPQQLDDLLERHRPDATPPPGALDAVSDGQPAPAEPDPADRGGPGERPPEVFEIATTGAVPLPDTRPQARWSVARGRGAQSAPSGGGSGPARRVVPDARSDGALALAATLRAAAPHQVARRGTAEQGPLVVHPDDLRRRRREPPAGACILFVVDASGSMAAERLMAVAKGAVQRMLVDAYQRRDEVALIAFRGARAELVLPPTSSVEQAEQRLRALPTGGRTPLAHGIQLAHEVVQRNDRQGRRSLIVFLSDGRANVALDGGAPLDDAYVQARALRATGVQTLVLDSEAGSIQLGLARRLADALGATYHRLRDLDSAQVSATVRTALDGGPHGPSTPIPGLPRS